MLCYVNHHDKAYHWAERRKLETHPKTGAAQIVEVREAVREIVVPVYTPAVAETVNRPKPSTRIVSRLPGRRTARLRCASGVAGRCQAGR